MKIRLFVDAGRQVWDRAGDGLLAAGLFAASLALYVQTLAPSVAALFDDSLEFPLVCYRLGIAHPTGYPLYTLLGKLFTLGPGGNVAWSVNLLSAVMGALAVALAYLVIRELARRRLAAVLGAMALTVSPVFWSQSVVAEVYTLNVAFVAALLWLALRWARRPLVAVVPFSLLLFEVKKRGALFLPGEGIGSRLLPQVRQALYRLYVAYRRVFPKVPPKRRLRPHPLIFIWVALFGLSLTHHRTILLLAPALLVFAFLVERRVFSRAALLGPEYPQYPRWQQVVRHPVVLLALCLLVPLLLYLYLPLRGHVGSLDGTYANTWQGFWRWVMASDYNVFLGENPLARDLDAVFYLDLFRRQFGPVGLALALVGLIALWRRPKILALTSLAFFTYVAFAIIYRVPDVEVFLIPAFLVTAIWVGVGLNHAADLLHPRGPSLALRRLLAASCVLVYLAAIAQPLVIAVQNYPDLDLSRRWIVHDYGQYLLQQELPHGNTTLVGLLGEMNLLRYFQETTGLRVDIETIVADDEAARRDAVESALATGRAVHVTRPLPGLTGDHALDAVTGIVDVLGEVETLARVVKPDSDALDPPRLTTLKPAPGLQLLGYGLHEHRGHWQAWARLRLWWRTPEGLNEPLKISARLVDGDGRVVAATDAEPVSGLYPTTAWQPGEVVVDAYEIPLPAGLPPGDYRPLVIVYEPSTGAELGRAELAPIYLVGNPARPPQRALEASVARTLYARFRDMELLGFMPPDPEVPYRPGDSLPLGLLWQAGGQPAGDWQALFWLDAIEDHALGEEPVGGRFPVDQWTSNQVVAHWPNLPISSDVPAGTYRLVMRVTRDGQPIPWGRGTIPLGSDLDLGMVQVGR